MSVSCSIRDMVRAAQDLIYPIAKLYLFDEYECTSVSFFGLDL
jgi:hypothetical protein